MTNTMWNSFFDELTKISQGVDYTFKASPPKPKAPFSGSPGKPVAPKLPAPSPKPKLPMGGMSLKKVGGDKGPRVAGAPPKPAAPAPSAKPSIGAPGGMKLKSIPAPKFTTPSVPGKKAPPGIKAKEVFKTGALRNVVREMRKAKGAPIGKKVPGAPGYFQIGSK